MIDIIEIMHVSNEQNDLKYLGSIFAGYSVLMCATCQPSKNALLSMYEMKTLY